MDLQKILGQLFILGFQGAHLCNSEIIEDIHQRNLGGVILFDKFLYGGRQRNNIETPEQLKSLCMDLQKQAKTKLLISIDQEGGQVCRLKEAYGFPAIPSAEEMGRLHPKQLSSPFAHTTAKLLAEIGINCNYAPVADLNLNPQNPVIGKLGRSFSEHPATVADHCLAWLDGLRSERILGCLKHFPGHGSSTIDSHKGFVDISDTWRKEELLPYSTLIDKNNVNAIMIGHVYNRNLDSEYPASLSPRVINGMLRKKLHFDGLVISDDLQMKAITDKYGLLDAVVYALAAGIDMIIIGNNLDYEPGFLKKAVIHVEKNVAAGNLSRQSIMTSYNRIQRIKETIL